MITEHDRRLMPGTRPPRRHAARRFLFSGRGAHRSLAAALRRSCARGRRRRAERASDALFAEAVVLFGEVAPLEAFFAYPGPRLMAAIEQALAERNAGRRVRLVQHVSAALLTGAYRHDAAAWDPLQEEGAARAPTLLPPICRPATATSRTSRRSS